MTPLALRLSKQLVMPVKERNPVWQANIKMLRDSLYDIHCFEVTQVLPLLEELVGHMHDRWGYAKSVDDVPQDASEFIGRSAFLPAEKTWIEWLVPGASRIALLLQDTRGALLPDYVKLPQTDYVAAVTLFAGESAGSIGFISLNSDDYQRAGGPIAAPAWLAEMQPEGGKNLNVVDGLLSAAHLYLVLINTPKIIGSREHMPHVGLKRELARGFGKGKFPLHAWNEIKLQITKPVEIDDGEAHQSHLTGRRALHFCRKHIRIRNGKLEYVSAHWRGDAAIGIRRSRYKVEA